MTTGQSMTSTTQNTSLLSCCIHFLLFFNKSTPSVLITTICLYNVLWLCILDWTQLCCFLLILFGLTCVVAAPNGLTRKSGGCVMLSWASLSMGSFYLAYFIWCYKGSKNGSCQVTFCWSKELIKLDQIQREGK